MKTKGPGKYDAPCAGYLYPALYDRMTNLKDAIATLKVDCGDFDTIVCTGVSGVLFASPLALLMKKNLVIVRKAKDASHSSNRIEANCFADDVGKWIFVDDLIDSGKTLKRVKREMGLWAEDAEYLGNYLYEDGYFADGE